MTTHYCATWPCPSCSRGWYVAPSYPGIANTSTRMTYSAEHIARMIREEQLAATFRLWRAFPLRFTPAKGSDDAA